MTPKFCRYSNIVTLPLPVSITGGTVDSEYPATYLIDKDPATPMKMTTSTTTRIVFDFGATQRVDGIVVPMHNFPQASTVYWMGDTVNTFLTPPLSASISVPQWDLSGLAPSFFIDCTAISGYTPTGYRYWCLIMPSGVTQQIGEIIVCKQLETFTYTWLWGGTVDEERWLNELETEFGRQHLTDMGVNRRWYTLDFQTTRAGLTQLRNIWRDARGGRYGWVFIPDADDSTSEAFYARFGDESAKRFTYKDEFIDEVTTTLKLREVYRGLQL